VSDASWYEGGLRFRCTQCGDCCTGAPGDVWVNEDEIAALAAHLSMEVAAFEEQYVRRRGIRRSLFERLDGDCILFDPETRGCTVYQARPVQCRTWPFWNDNVASPDNWKHTCEVCPGSGQGDLVPLSGIRERIAQTAAARRKL
jgi:hypothetical protein